MVKKYLVRHTHRRCGHIEVEFRADLEYIEQQMDPQIGDQYPPLLLDGDLTLRALCRDDYEGITRNIQEALGGESYAGELVQAVLTDLETVLEAVPEPTTELEKKTDPIFRCDACKLTDLQKWAPEHLRRAWNASYWGTDPFYSTPPDDETKKLVEAVDRAAWREFDKALRKIEGEAKAGNIPKGCLSSAVERCSKRLMKDIMRLHVERLAAIHQAQPQSS